mmetsp:Transcript_41978/g.108758  ORF Transcript_41978/g.108758 Transcript_41978/m.108758 type:complete len:212 (-) Transcript_41978:336-971(-)
MQDALRRLGQQLAVGHGGDGGGELGQHRAGPLQPRRHSRRNRHAQVAKSAQNDPCAAQSFLLRDGPPQLWCRCCRSRGRLLGACRRRRCTALHKHRRDSAHDAMLDTPAADQETHRLGPDASAVGRQPPDGGVQGHERRREEEAHVLAQELHAGVEDLGDLVAGLPPKGLLGATQQHEEHDLPHECRGELCQAQGLQDLPDQLLKDHDCKG